MTAYDLGKFSKFNSHQPFLPRCLMIPAALIVLKNIKANETSIQVNVFLFFKYCKHSDHGIFGVDILHYTKFAYKPPDF